MGWAVITSPPACKPQNGDNIVPRRQIAENIRHHALLLQHFHSSTYGDVKIQADLLNSKCDQNEIQQQNTSC